MDWEPEEEEAVGARNTLACGLSCLWSLFPNCPSLQKDTIRWWDELYHPVPSSRGRAHCATGHPPTKDQCVPSTNPHLPSQSFPLPQFSLQELLGIGNKSPPCPHPMHLCSPGFVFGSGRWEHKRKNLSFPASLLSGHPSLHIIFAIYGNLQTDPNTNQHPQPYFPRLCFFELTSPRETSHAAYSWLCSCGLGRTGDISSGQLNSAKACFLALRPAGTTWPCPDYDWCVSNPPPPPPSPSLTGGQLCCCPHLALAASLPDRRCLCRVTRERFSPADRQLRA